MDWDHLAEEYNDKLFAGWLQLISVQSPALPSRLAAQHRRGIAWVADVLGFTTGAYNICCIFTFENGFRALVRFPFLGRSRFRTEKSRNEALAMKLLSQNTALPVPRIPGMGRWGCGPCHDLHRGNAVVQAPRRFHNSVVQLASKCFRLRHSKCLPRDGASHLGIV